eukprot:TRINITY_DN37217_c0_g1_i1.p1 TRINITY_DN37217_c0_g1~~TRINITY_DN37217_c0_g1_i1.p1  ORF type:complete len:101 (+),score=26.77 TRINITY_DN37217_c0_g1_i1:32-334(+)
MSGSSKPQPTPTEKRTQKMTVMLGFAVSLMTLLFLISIVRSEMLAADVGGGKMGQKIDLLLEKIEEMEAVQQAQSMALQRIGGMLTSLQADAKKSCDSPE